MKRNRFGPGVSGGPIDYQLLFEAMPGMFLAVLPDDPSFTVGAVSDSYLRALSKTREEMVGRSLFEVFPEGPDPAHATTIRNVRASFQRVLATGKLDRMPVQRYDIPKPGHEGALEERYWSLVSSPVLDGDGSLQVIIHRVDDVTDRTRAEEARRRSEERLTFALEGAHGLGTWDYDVPADRLYCNARFAQLFSVDPQRAAEGAPLSEFMPAIHPDDRAGVAEKVTRAIEAGGDYAAEYRVLSKEGSLGWLYARGRGYVDSAGTPTRLIGVAFDITERKIVERRDALLVRLDDAVRPLTDPHEITQTAAKLLGEHLEVNRCAYADVEEDEDTFTLTGDYNSGVPSIVDRYTFTQFGDECLRLMREGQPYVVTDSETDPRTEQVRDSYRLTLIRSVVCVSLRKKGSFVAAMAVHQAAPRGWRPDEIELVQLVASRCWESIERARIARELRASAQQLRAIYDGTYEYIGLLSPDGILMEANRASLEFAHSTRDDVVGRPFWETPWFSNTPGAPEAVRMGVARAATGEFVRYEATLSRPSGELLTFDISLHPIRNEHGEVVLIVPEGRDITERKHAEAHLRQQWHTFDTALSHTPDFMYIFDLEGRFTYVNRALLSLLQKSLDEAIGKNFLDLDYPPELAERLQRQIQQVVDTRELVRDHTPFTGSNGESRDYEYIFVPVFAADGRVEAVAGSTRDITDGKRSETLLQMVIDNVPGLVSYLDRDVRYRFANRLYQDWFKSGPLVGRTVSDVVGEEAFARVTPYLEKAFAGTPVRFEEFLPYKNGRQRYVQVSYMPDEAADGTVRGVVAMVQDITSQKKMEQALRRSEERLQQVFEQAPVAIVVIRGHEFKVELANPFFQALIQGKTLVGRRFADIVPELGQHVWDVFNRVLDTGEPFVANDWPVSYDQDGDGIIEDHWFNVVYHPLRDGDGTVSGMVAVCSDVTVQVMARKELERVNRELEEFAYVASHDLREPLRMINIYTQLLVRELQPHLTDRALGFAGHVQGGVHRIEQLLRDLLNFSHVLHAEKIETSRLRIADLNASSAQAIGTLEQRIREEHALVTIDPLPIVHGDELQLTQVFQNLIANSLKYRNPNEPPVVRVTARQEGREWIITVCDNGIGFSQNHAERIFGLFKRLHKDEYPGTGLGLAICKRIIERSGGRIWAESELGQGSKFSFALPEAARE